MKEVVGLARRLVRPMSGRMIAGVCAGIARYLNVDPTLVRLLWVLLGLHFGNGILLYLLAWIIMPDEAST